MGNGENIAGLCGDVLNKMLRVLVLLPVEGNYVLHTSFI